MRISLIQMNMKPEAVDENYSRAASLIEECAAGQPDVIVLPETWSTGFYPKEHTEALADQDGEHIRDEMGAIASKYGVNIVAGSIVNKRCENVYNTAFIFDREGRAIASYDKTHLFSPMGEDGYFTPGDHLCRFELDGVSCGIIICYDVRFPELTRMLALEGIDVLFMVSQWPDARADHLRTLLRARAIENQMFVCGCNSCGRYGTTQYGGGSVLIDPWGKVIAEAGAEEEVVTGDLDLSVVEEIRSSINVFRDRRADLYHFEG